MQLNLGDCDARLRVVQFARSQNGVTPGLKFLLRSHNRNIKLTIWLNIAEGWIALLRLWPIPPGDAFFVNSPGVTNV